MTVDSAHRVVGMHCDCDGVALPPGGQLVTDWAALHPLTEGGAHPLHEYTTRVAELNKARTDKPVRGFGEHLANPGKIRDVMGRFGTVREYLTTSGKIWQLQGRFGTFREYLGHSGNNWDIQRTFRTFREYMGHVGNIWHIQALTLVGRVLWCPVIGRVIPVVSCDWSGDTCGVLSLVGRVMPYPVIG